MDYVDTISLRDKGSWHGKEMKTGGIFTGDTTVSEQLLANKMYWKYHKLPVGVTLPDGTFMETGDRWAVMREPANFDPNWARMRIVGNRYEIVQNKDLARTIDPLTKDWPLESLGSLKNGRIVFMELATGGFDVGGREPHKTYLLVADDKGAGSLVWATVVVRVVCWNTFNLSRQTASSWDTIPHTSDPKAELNFRQILAENSIKQELEIRKTLDALFSRRVTPVETGNVIRVAFPTPKVPRSQKRMGELPETIDLADPRVEVILEKGRAAKDIYERQIERTMSLRGEVGRELLKFNDEFPYAANTAHAVWNSVTSIVNHSPSFKGTDEKNQVSLLFGQKSEIQKRAWDAVRTLV